MEFWGLLYSPGFFCFLRCRFSWSTAWCSVGAFLGSHTNLGYTSCYVGVLPAVSDRGGLRIDGLPAKNFRGLRPSGTKVVL